MSTARRKFSMDVDDALLDPPAPAAEAAPVAPPSRGPLEEAEIDSIAEVITPAQIDRLVRLRARVAKRDEWAKQGIRPSTHVITTGAVVIMMKDKRGDLKRHEVDTNKPLLIADLPEETHAWLLEHGHAERPE